MTDEATSLPPKVWAKIATYTFSKSGILCINQVCRASHDGITNTTGPWRVLEKKYGILQNENPVSAREHVIEYVKIRNALKRELSEFSSPNKETRLTKMLQNPLERMGRADPSTYYQMMTALCSELPPSSFFAKFHLEPSSELSEQIAMASLCAVYAAVCKTRNILVLVRADDIDDDMMSSYDTVTALKCMCDLLTRDVAKHVEPPLVSTLAIFRTIPRDDIVSSSREAECASKIILHNASTISLHSMVEYPPPKDKEFDGIVVCAKYLGLPPDWMLAPDYPLPKYRVHFG